MLVLVLGYALKNIIHSKRNWVCKIDEPTKATVLRSTKKGNTNLKNHMSKIERTRSDSKQLARYGITKPSPK